VEVLNLARRSRLCIRGTDIFPWGSEPTVATLEYIVLPSHVAALELSTWWGHVLFATRLKIAVWIQHLLL
jgi:hypothetical protein